jgi:hypothetical protein
MKRTFDRVINDQLGRASFRIKLNRLTSCSTQGGSLTLGFP